MFQLDIDEASFAWHGDAAEARQRQKALAERVRLGDDFGPVNCVAGVDVGFEEGGAVTRAAAVLLKADTRQLIGQALVRQPTVMPYVPGLLSFRELPALIAALQQLDQRPDLVFVDGHGIAHPRRLGIAAHLGVATDLATIGVAKKVLCGRHEALAEMRGAQVPLLHRGERIGTVLRSKHRVRPLIVSPGHRLSHDTAVAQVLAFDGGYRLPEPTRLADRLASRRGPLPDSGSSR
ncbi:deoxyribonuclease V [Oleiagrimonas sp. C23AA]|uniref:deoxyribonuclease V n=1 Tax=Oleiagrimonas sp. C23AA TaxID=2719047 RepID=UPI0014244FA3|nr:deoxyribonuclease V [Oleiagrimonas sp. C23AA]NII09296.1 deoxyribonuclease V [Oleiagrimonas sp. C23AA]